MRRLGLIFGSSAVSIGICLAAFMAGLGIGSLWIGRAADRSARPERLYAGLELGIGAYGMLSPMIFSAGNILFQGLFLMAGPSAGAVFWLKAVCSFALLMVPTILMGGTFPAAVRYLTTSDNRRGIPLGFFYAANTIGAAAAAFLLPTVLLGKFGMNGTTMLAAAGNLVAALGALLLPRMVSHADDHTRAANVGTNISTSSRRDIACAFFISGFVALGLETLYNRVFIMTFGSSIYSFSFILGVYLLGIGAGGGIFSLIESRFQARHIFLGAQAVAWAGLISAIPFFDRSVFLQLRLFDMLEGQFAAFHAANIAVATVFAGIPALAFGIGYPAALKALTESSGGRLGRNIGWWSAVNAAGTTLGSLVMTFVLLPAVGSFVCFIILAGLLCISIVWIAGPARLASIAVGILLAVFMATYIFSVPRWDLRHFHTQVGMSPNTVLSLHRSGTLTDYPFEVRWFREGRDGTVSVIEYKNELGKLFPDGGGANPVSLFVNGKVDASDDESDMLTQSLLAHLPMQFVRRMPEHALIVGLGSGVTAAELARYPIEHIDAVEISPDVAVAARTFFPHVNRGALTGDSKIRLIVDDGRNFLSMPRPERYDLIISEPSNSWLSGASNLFTREYFDLVRGRLAPDGILCKWFYTYSMSWDNLMSMLAAVSSEFEYVEVFTYKLSGDLLILASQRPIRVPNPLLEHGLRPEMSAPGALSFIRSANDLLRGHVLGPADVRRLTATHPAHTDDIPVLELRGPKDLFLRSASGMTVRFAEEAPAVMLGWDLTTAQSLQMLGLPPDFTPDIWGLGPPRKWTLTDSGIRVVTFMDETRHYLPKQSFASMKWSAPDETRLEVLMPLRGPSERTSHRLTLAGFSGQAHDSAMDVQLPDGTPAAKMVGDRRVDWAWNIRGTDGAERTLFVCEKSPK